MKRVLQKLWFITLWFALIYSTQHLVRDVLSDIFGIHNAFTEFLHRESPASAWCYGFCQWTTFPVEIFYILASLRLLKKGGFGLIGVVMIIFIVPILLQYFGII
ncbi:MAG: hypothetical protein ABID04_02300 [Patescibacteria group bacterium]